MFGVTSGKCLHSFQLRFYFCDQSFESHGISCYVYRIGPGILHILFYLCQIRVTASKADVTNCFCLIWWFCILFGTIVFVWSDGFYFLSEQLFEVRLVNVLVRQSWWVTLLTEYRFSLFLLAQMTDSDDDGDVEDNDDNDVECV